MRDSTVIYPGTFDPITLGHMDLIERVAPFFDKIIVAVAEDTRKSTLFPLNQRISLADSILGHNAKVTVMGFKGLLVNFCEEVKVNIILRGVRAVSDFDYEFQLAGMNRRMAPHIETIFMSPSEQFAFVSATMVREIAALGGEVDSFVHPIVKCALYKQFGRE